MYDNCKLRADKYMTCVLLYLDVHYHTLTCVFMHSDVRRLTIMCVIVHHTFSDVWRPLLRMIVLALSGFHLADVFDLGPAALTM